MTEIEMIESRSASQRKWAKEEDDKLIRLVAKLGKTNWSLIAQRMGADRTATTCRNRYNNFLNPTIKLGAWDIEEDQMIFDILFESFDTRIGVLKEKLNRSRTDIKKRLKCFKSLIDSDFLNDERLRTAPKRGRKRKLKSELKENEGDWAKNSLVKLTLGEYSKATSRGKEKYQWTDDITLKILDFYSIVEFDWDQYTKFIPDKDPLEIKAHFYTTLRWSLYECKRLLKDQSFDIIKKFPFIKPLEIESIEPSMVPRSYLIPYVCVAKHLIAPELSDVNVIQIE